MKFAILVDGLNAKIREVAVELIAETLPGRLERGFIERAYARALRNGAWFRIPDIYRGLIWSALRSSIWVFKSRGVVNALRRALAWLELYTLRGLVVLLGLSYGLPRRLISLGGSLLGKLDYIRYLGRRLLASINYYPSLPI